MKLLRYGESFYATVADFYATENFIDGSIVYSSLKFIYSGGE